MRIGVDVGGTHTDAVILDGDEIIAVTKSLTTADVVSGISNALDEVLHMSGVQTSKVASVMIGTTQFTNAIVERKSLTRIAAVRLGLPSGRGMPPMIDWPEDMRVALTPGSICSMAGIYLTGDGLPIFAKTKSRHSSMISKRVTLKTLPCLQPSRP